VEGRVLTAGSLLVTSDAGKAFASGGDGIGADRDDGPCVFSRAWWLFS